MFFSGLLLVGLKVSARITIIFKNFYRIGYGFKRGVLNSKFISVNKTNAVSSLQRISILDGFRAIAIYWVALYHYLHRWAEILPFGKTYADIIIFEYGYLGVNLFFIISGFVITLTLSKTAELLVFFIKRFARLWPPMLICSIITFTFMTVFNGHRDPDILYFIPSLTFIGPEIWERILGFKSMRWMDGAYWSLWVEVRFYFLAGVIYYLSKKSFLRIWLIFSALIYVLVILGIPQGKNIVSNIIENLFITRDLPWFTAGICFFYIFKNRETILPNIGIMVSFVFLLVTFPNQRQTGGHADESNFLICMFISVIFLLFYLFIYKPQIVKVFGSRLFSGIGIGSYTLYLLHQDIGVTLIMKSGWLIDAVGAIPVVMSIILGLTLIARFLYKYWEEPSKRFILRKAL
jgi:peptidoglycan/LPS O-acetylase OafA/YrhL